MGYRLKRKAVIILTWMLAALSPLTDAPAAESGPPIGDFAVRTWTRAEGLPDDSVTAILQTRAGFLWVGTATRLVRFDGLTFTEYPLLADTNAPARITSLGEDATGKLWIGTQSDGLFRLDEAGPTSYRKAAGLVDDRVTSLSADGQGRVWIGTRAGLSRWDGKGFTSFGPGEGLADESVISVHVARSGAVWITTRSGMYQFKDASPAPTTGATPGRITAYDFEPDSQGRSPEYLGAYEGRSGNLWAYGDTYLINLSVEKRYNHFRGVDATRIGSLCEARDGRLWIATSGRGLVCFDNNNFQTITVDELRWRTVRVICEDREGNLWLGTDGGLVELLPQPVQVLRADQGLPPGAATCLATDAAGRIFAGFATGGLFVGAGEQFDRFPAGGGGEAQYLIASLCVAADETLWIATLGHGLYGVSGARKLHLTTLNGLADNSLAVLGPGPDGAVWAGTRAGALHRIKPGEITTYGTEHGLSGAPISALLTARDGTLWLGTEAGQVLRREAARFVLLHQITAASGPSILALHEDARGRVWFGADAAGLGCWNGQRVVRWSTLHGLPDDSIYGVISDGDGGLWLATGRGIFRAPPEAVQDALVKGEPWRGKLIFATRRSEFRVPSSEFGWPRVLPANDGRLWFATPEGLVVVDRSGPDLSRLTAPPVYLEKVSVNGKAWKRQRPNGGRRGTEPPPARLPAEVESLDLEFTAPSFVAPDKLNFRYRLEGQDRDWVAAGTERRARYGRLAYGDYRFRVAVSAVEGVWNEAPEGFAFTVPTPLWRTPAAVAGYILAAVAAVAGLARVVSTRRLRAHLAKVEQQRLVERERMRIAQDMHDDIGSKLTKISFLSERARMASNGNGAVAGQIEAIATTSRELLQTLDEIVWAVNPRNDTLEHLAAYLSHYAAEYFQNTAVQCVMRLPREIPHHPLTAELRHNLFLAFEEVLNNALKHSGASQVSLEMVMGREDFQINVTDNGRGFDVAATHEERPAGTGRRGGNGLLNLRQRLSVLGGECVVRSEPGAGTTVTLRIPLGGSVKIQS